jgi:hypothetical protein
VSAQKQPLPPIATGMILEIVVIEVGKKIIKINKYLNAI